MLPETSITLDTEEKEELCYLLTLPDDCPNSPHAQCTRQTTMNQYIAKQGAALAWSQQVLLGSVFTVSCWLPVLLLCFVTLAMLYVFLPASVAVRLQQQTDDFLQVPAHQGPSLAAQLYDGNILPATLDDSHCNKFSSLKFLRSEYMNLGGHGPDMGKGEGLIWRAELQSHLPSVHGRQEIFLHMNTVGGVLIPSTPTSSMQGNYGRITLGGGSNVHLRFTFEDVHTKKTLMLPQFSLTFFDLDADHSGIPRDVVTVGNFSEYHLASETVVEHWENQDGSTSFKGTTFGTGDDNPADPTFIGPQQKRRAVTLIFEEASEVTCTFQAKHGSEPQSFTFTGLAALPCARTAYGDLRPSLRDLDWIPPLQVPVAAGKNEKFLRWQVGLGDQVQKGDDLCAVQQGGPGVVKFYQAPFDGVVSGIQSELKKGEEIDSRLSEKTLVIITRSMLGKLDTSSPAEKVVRAHPGEFFVKWCADLFTCVMEGQVIAEIRNKHGAKRQVHSPISGCVVARQNLLEADPAELLEDGHLAVIGKLPPVPIQGGETPVIVPQGMYFQKWLHNGGDFVNKGDCIALVKHRDGGPDIQVLVPRTGLIRSVQQHLQHGMALNAVMQGAVLATLGKVPPLEVKRGQAATRVPLGNGWIFKDWKASVGSEVRKGDAVALVALSNGTQRAVLAVKSGILSAIQSDLRDGTVISDVIQDCNIAVIGRYAALAVGWGQKAVESPSEALFKRWYVTETDEVQKGTHMAEVEMPIRLAGGRQLLAATTIVAPSAGVISRLQPLVSGQSISTQQHGRVIAVLQSPLDHLLPTHWVLVLGHHMPPPWVVAVVACCVMVCLVLFLSVLGRCLALQSKHVQDSQQRTLSYPIEAMPPGFKPCPSQEQAEIVFLVPPSSEPHETTSETSGVPTPVAKPTSPINVSMNPNPLHEAGRVDESDLTELHPDNTKRSIRLDFHTNNNAIVTRQAWYQPLGIQPDPADPTVVGSFLVNSYAAASLSIERGWKIVRIGDEELSGKLKAAALNQKMLSHMRDLPVWPLRLTFKMPPTAVAAVDESTSVFKERPLGMELIGKDSLKVSKVYVGSPAHNAGVREGCFITALNGGAATMHTATAPLMMKDGLNGRQLREAVASLPSSGKKYGAGVAWKPWGSSMKL